MIKVTYKEGNIVKYHNDDIIGLGTKYFSEFYQDKNYSQRVSSYIHVVNINEMIESNFIEDEITWCI